MNQESKPLIIIVIAVVIIAAIAGILWYSRSVRPGVAPQPPPPSVNNRGTNVSDLGSQIYNQAQNPVGGKIPDTATPPTNPIKDVYKNPFGY